MPTLVFQDGESAGACVFVPHGSLVSCMHFSPWHPAHLLSLSNDALRCGDVTRAVFDEVSAAGALGLLVDWLCC